MQTSKCPVCNSDVIIEDEAIENDLLECTNCGKELEIVSMHPVRLEKIEIGQEEEKEENIE